MTFLKSCACGLIAALVLAPMASAKVDPALHDQALEMLKRAVAFRTVHGAGQTPAYAAYLKSVLVAAGYRQQDIRIEEMAGTALLTARYPGRDRTAAPMVILGHMDVVEARREDWTRDPFTPVVQNGYLYGRGAVDNKFDVTMAVTTLAKLKREGWTPGRDVILALSGDEETAMATTRKLAQDLSGAAFVLNADAGGGTLDLDGRPVVYGLQAAEKTYADFLITFTDAGGHSSRPTPGNAIYRLARTLERIEAYHFAPMANDITRAEFAIRGKTTEGPMGEAMRRFAADPTDASAIAALSADLDDYGRLRTTCVATMINGGHAPNALPQKASATINCRIFPGVSVVSVRRLLMRLTQDRRATVERLEDGSVESPASPLDPEITAAVEAAVHATYPGLPIAPSMSEGATDSMHFRAAGVPSYGVAGLFSTPGDTFAHGRNEKAPLAAIDGALVHWDTLLRSLAK